MEPYEDQIALNECFNEAEVTIEGKEILEPEIEEVCSYKTKKTKGKRDEDLKNIPVEVIPHKQTEKQLTLIFGKDNWKELPEEVYKRLTFHPAVF